MKKLTLALSVLAITAVASGAQAMINDRTSTLDLSGAQAKQLVQDQGSIILSTGPGLFDRYVANSTHCSFDQRTKAAFVPTADGKSFIGYTCQADPRNDS